MEGNLFTHKNLILLRELVKTDFKLRYQGSLIGYAWSLLKPLMLFAVMYVVFVRFLRFGADVPHFAVALLLGMVLWGFFAETTSMGMMSVLMRGDLLRKIHFPAEIIVISASIGALINLLISFVVVICFAIVNEVDITYHLLIYVPFLLIELYLFSLGVAFYLADYYVKYRDIGPIWEVLLQVGMYATPIIYPLSLVIKESEKAAKWVLMNPMAQIIQDMRHILISPYNLTAFDLITTWWVWTVPFIITIVVFISGYWRFKKNCKYYAEIL